MTSISAQVSQGGRIVIPAEMRRKMGIKAGDQVLLTWSDESNELRVATRKQRLQHARELVSRYTHPAAGSVVDELIQDRRLAASEE